MVLDNFPVYFRLHGVSLAAIGALSLLRTPWWAKVFWSPLVDQVGERRQWIRGALIVMAAALLAVAALPAAPVAAPLVVALFVFTIAAATQDVAIDAYTIELLVPGEEGVANGVRVSAYRAALVFAGGVLVALAGRAGWPTTFAVAADGSPPSAAESVGALAPGVGEPSGRDPGLPLRAPLQARHERDRAHGEAVLGRPGAQPRRDRVRLDHARRGRLGGRCAGGRCAHLALGHLSCALGAGPLPGRCQSGLRGRRVERCGAGGHLRRLARRELRRRPRHGGVPRLPDERLRQAAGGDAVRAALGALQPERVAGGGGVGARGGVDGLRALLRADVHLRAAGVRDAAVGAGVDRGETDSRVNPRARPCLRCRLSPRAT